MDWEDEDDMTALEYFDTINHCRFWCSSSYAASISKWGSTDFAHTLWKAREGTLFQLLPFEMILLICQQISISNIEESRQYYLDYFDSSNTSTEVLRTVRSRKLKSDETDPLVKREQSPMGPIWVRRIYGYNAASMCYKAIATFIKDGASSIPQLKKMYKMQVNWMIWVCDHSYIDSWNRFMEVWFEKIKDFEREIVNIDITKHKKLTTIELKEEATEIIKEMKYFMDYYLPYSLLTRSEVFYDTVKMEFKKECFIEELLFKLYTRSGIHPNMINVDDIYEFELRTYASDYYYTVYQNHTKLGNGKRFIPNGENPSFYWVGDTYVPKFS